MKKVYTHTHSLKSECVSTPTGYYKPEVNALYSCCLPFAA